VSLDREISENWTLGFNVHKDERTRLQRKPCNLYQRHWSL